jgi:hypothetical protein
VIGPRSGLVALVGASVACTILTHAEDYAVAPATADTRLCAACPQAPQLRHPPCPATSVTPSDDPAIRFYALQTIDLGSHASEWGTIFFHAGFDMDCSARPGGAPTSCLPSGPIPVTWASLPDGTDNAFATQILAPLLTGPYGIDVQQSLNASITRGEWAWILAIDHWNGTPDDAQVGVRLLQAEGTTAGGAPTWSSDETWIAYADAWDPAFATGQLPDTSFKTTDAYVTQGTLVWDMRGLPLQTPSVRSGQAVLTLDMEPVGFFGLLTEGSLQQASLGGLLQNEILAFGVLDLASGCAPALACQLTGDITETVASVQDMVSLTTPGEAYCNRISFGSEPYLVRIGGVSAIAPTTSEPASCDIQRQLTCSDAGRGTD